MISSKPLNDLKIFKEAYNEIKSKKGNLTPGVYKETLDGMSPVEKLQKLQESVLNWTYQCKPTKRIYIPKANGKIRPLGIPSTIDKIILLVLKKLLEPKCQQLFHPKSVKSVQEALWSVRGMVGITWMIEGDIKGYFDNIDHNTLVGQIKDRLQPDRTILGLILKFRRAGYLENEGFKHSILGIPQGNLGGVLSPLLSNLYLTALDEFVENLQLKYNTIKVSERNPEYRKIESKILSNRRKLIRTNVKRSEEEIKDILENIKKDGVQPTRPSCEIKLLTIRSGSKIHYVRYADDWVIGVVGTREFAEQIKQEIKYFLRETLKLELSDEKTKITHLGSGYAHFLGHYIRCSTLKHNSTRRRDSIGGILNIQKGTAKPKILVPLDILRGILIKAGFANEKGVPKYVGKFIYLSDAEIIRRYNSILRGFMNFYNLAENRSKLNEMVYTLEYSLAHTLAAKHRLSLKKVFNKYGKPFQAKVEKGGGVVTFDKTYKSKCRILKYAKRNVAYFKN